MIRTIFLILYFIFLFGWGIYSVLIFFNIRKFAFVGDPIEPVMVVYLLTAAVMIITTLVFILTGNW